MARFERRTGTDAVERWFVHRGVPQAIFHYNAADDVFTRMVPYLAIMFLLGALAGFGERFSGWAQFGVAIAAMAILVALAVVVNRWRGRRTLQLPDSVGAAEIGVFLVGAPLVALVFGDDRATRWWQLLVLNVVVLAIGYVVTAYGLLPMMRWGLREVGIQVRGITTLLARSLPLLLLFATFLFLNAEMWQVAHELTAPLYVVVIAMVLVPAVLFLVLRTPSEVENLHTFATWQEVDEICARTDAPLGRLGKAEATGRDVLQAPLLVDLDRGERQNLSLLMLIAQMVQIALVALVIGVFYVGFGLVTVREETLLQWTELDAAGFSPLARFSLFGAEIVLTWELFAVSGFIAAISALQFAVSVATDEVYRTQFTESLESEIREVLAVRARYLEPMVRDVLQA